jgi:hypothetical protein
MAYLELTAGQVDADSPVDETLMEQIRDNQIYFKAQKLEIDGTIAMTGNLNMGTNDIDNAGDITGDTVTLSAGSGTGFDSNGKNAVFEDVQINGTLSGANLVATAVMVAFTGTNETSAGNGDFRDTTHESEDVDFTDHLTDAGHFVYIPAVADAACFFVETVTDADNLELADSNTEGKNARAYGNANPYWILDGDVGITGPGADATAWAKMKEFSWASADTTDRTLVIDGTAMGGKKRTAFIIEYNLGGAGAGTMTADYGDTTLTIGSNGNDGVAMFIVLAGNNTLTITKSGNTGVATAKIWFDHVQPLAGTIT